jgi:hypothetical protein
MQVHPLDGTVAVEDHHAVGQGFGGAAKAVQLLGGLFAFGAGQAGAPVQGFENRAPGAAGARRRRAERASRPAISRSTSQSWRRKKKPTMAAKP